MKIALSQPEIKEAVRQYMVEQGFKLDGKIFDAAFSMGKGERGLSAIVTIESATADTAIPGFTGAASDEEEAALKADTTVEDTTQPGTVGAVITETAKEVVATTAKADAAEAAPKAETKVEAPAPAAATEPDVATAGGDDAGIFD